MRVGPDPKDVYSDYAIFMIHIESCGSCNPEGYSLRWWNEANGAAGTGEVVEASGCFPGFGCSCWLEGLIWPDDPPIAMGENLVWVEVTDPGGSVAVDSILIIRHEAICPCFTAADVAARLAEVPTMRVRAVSFSSYSDSSCQGFAMQDELATGAWGYRAGAKDYGVHCVTSAGEQWFDNFCVNADGRFAMTNFWALTCVETLRAFATP